MRADYWLNASYWSAVPFLLMLLVLAPRPAFSETVQETIDQLQQTYEKMENLEAEFTQTVHFFDFEQQAISTGKVFLKKGKMRWDYQTPHQQQIVINGDSIQHYMPEHEQLLKSPLGRRTGLPINLFLGLENMGERFHITRQENNLLLIPKEAGAHVTQIDLTLSPPQSKKREVFIQKVVLHEENKNRSVFLFRNIRTHRSFRGDPFVLDLPKATEIIEMP